MLNLNFKLPIDLLSNKDNVAASTTKLVFFSKSNADFQHQHSMLINTTIIVSYPQPIFIKIINKEIYHIVLKL